MQRKSCEMCGGLVVRQNGHEPPLTQFGCVRCWACYLDDPDLRIEPPPERYETGRVRCKTCPTRMGQGRRCGRCQVCRQRHRRAVRRVYMRAYRKRQRSPLA